MVPSFLTRRSGALVVLALVLLAVGGATLIAAQELSPSADPVALALPPIVGQPSETASGPVTLDMVWLSPPDGLTFRVGMNTHSVILDGYDLSRLAVLRTAQGLEIPPARWEAPPGGHHRSGILTFPSALDDGTPIALDGGFVVAIRDVGGVAEQTFAWELP